jgi:hypothetical protein
LPDRDRVHRRHDLLQRQPDAQRDHDAGGDDDAEKNHGDRQHPARDIARQRPVEGLLRLLLALAHLDRQIVDRADGVGLAGVDGVAQQLGAAGELLGQFGKPSRSATVRVCNRCSARRCRSLSARSDITGMVFSIVSVLRRASSAELRTPARDNRRWRRPASR